MSLSDRKSKHKSKLAKHNNANKRCNKHRHPQFYRKKIKRIDNRINSFLGTANLNEIAKKTGYLIRSSPITPFIFIYALSMGLFGVEISLDLLAINMNSLFGTNLTGNAFSIRMGEKKSVLFLKACFEKFLSLQFDSAFDNNFYKTFPMFKAIILEDSTTIELNERLSKFYKGSGGAASKSSLKLNWVFNICCYAAVAVDIFSGCTADRKNAKTSLKHIKKGMLLVRDMGYFVVSNLRIIMENGAYYLSRIPKGTLLYLNEHDENNLDVEKFFKKITRGNRIVKIPIFIGSKERFSTTLIMQKVPKWVLKQRIKKYKKKNSGRLPSDDFITWAKYSVFITNISEELLISNSSSSFEDLIMEIYKIRWQIELLFKKFKSKIKLSIIKGKNKNRVLSTIYGRLIAIMLSLMVLSFAAVQNYKGREISLWKVISWLIAEGRLARAIRKGSLRKLYSDLCKQFRLLCKDKRNRKTTQEMLIELFPWEKLAS